MKLAINGFGRIGRGVFKIAMEREGVEIVGINDLGDIQALAHLLKYDSAYGVYIRDVRVEKDRIIVDGREVPVSAITDPRSLPWGDLQVDVAVESTGLFCRTGGDRGGYGDHIKAGAKKVILTAPAEDEINTVVLGVNEEIITPGEEAFSSASCTTNCLAPVVKILNDRFGILKGLVTTVHSYTKDQVVLDVPHGDPRLGRAAALNIIPTTTGAVLGLGEVIPALKGRLDGGAVRVPTPVGSLVDLSVQLNQDCSVKELNQAMEEAAAGELEGILEYSEAPLVSSDIRGNPHSSIFDAPCTTKVGEGFFKVIAWYDNEMAYSTRVVDLAQKLV